MLLLQRNWLQLIVGSRIYNGSFGRNRTNLQKQQQQQAQTQTKRNMSQEQQVGNKTIVAVAQMRSTNDVSANLKLVEQLIAQAKAQQVKFLFLPECCDYVGDNRKQTLELAQPLGGQLMQQYKQLAREHGIWLSLGGIHESVCNERQEKTDKVYNAHVILNDQGQLVSVYRKLHLFDVSTPDFRFRESDVVMPGAGIVPPISTPIGRLGMQICYDVRFAESSLLLRKAGADVLTYPSAFAYSTGKAHWEVLLRARAIENQCFVIAPAQVGFHNSKRQSWGHAMIVNPWGKVLVNCGADSELTIGTTELDLTAIAPIRASMPCFQHRRGDVYSLTTAYSSGQEQAMQDRAFANHNIRKETIFYESPHSFAFTNLRCVVEGHVLVSTKRIVSRLQGLDCDEITDLFMTVCKIQRMLEAVYKTTSATVTVQDGSDAGQTVPHVHFHVMPRRPGDFGHNDQIYVKLEDLNEHSVNRSLEERICEAQKYRDVLHGKAL